MRLICPECEVQYEVDAALIPAQGRDVQCSNCSHMWFVSPAPREPMMPDIRRPATPPDVVAPPAPDPVGHVDPEDHGVPDAPFSHHEDDPDDAPAPRPAEVHAFPGAAAEAPSSSWDEPDDAEDYDDRATAPADVDEGPSRVEATPTAAGPAVPQDAPAHAAADRTDDDIYDDADDDDRDDVRGFDPAEGDVALAPPPPREHDAEVLQILRAEAEREIAQRRRDADPLESQPDLGLDAAPPPARPTTPPSAAPVPTRAPSDAPGIEERVARIRGVAARRQEDARTEEEEALAEDRAADRSEPLPDVEEINSTLRPHSEHASEEPALARRLREEDRRRGFRGGFFAVTGIVAALILLYVAAPWVARTFPGLEPAMAAYVDGSNAAREGIDGAVSRSLSRLARLTGAD